MSGCVDDGLGLGQDDARINSGAISFEASDDLVYFGLTALGGEPTGGFGDKWQQEECADREDSLKNDRNSPDSRAMDSVSKDEAKIDPASYNVSECVDSGNRVLLTWRQQFRR